MTARKFIDFIWTEEVTVSAFGNGLGRKKLRNRKKGKIKFGHIVAVVGVIVLGAWMVATYRPCYLGLANQGLDARANAIGALFSGLAFVAVVVTLLYQQQELKLQRQELRYTRKELRRSAQAQEKSANESRKSSLRQSREQFLMSRLNATVAQSQTISSVISCNQGRLGDYTRLSLGNEVKRLSQDIWILLFEARLGFEGGAWSLAIERRAICDYLEDYFRRFELLFPLTYPEMQHDIIDHIQSAALEMRFLVERTKRHHPAISKFVESILDGALNPCFQKIIEGQGSGSHVLPEQKKWLFSTLEELGLSKLRKAGIWD